MNEPERIIKLSTEQSNFILIDEVAEKAIFQRRQTFDLRWQSINPNPSLNKNDVQQTDVSHQPFNLIF